MKIFRNFLSAGILAVVVFGVLFTGACKKKENNNDTDNVLLLLLASQPYVEQSKTGFFIIVPKGIAQ
ncbi:LIC12338 family lipoprotein [Leptospira kmetyi]|uniref:LIC12338 family lipoprotein n=1 Tax=Leptospira kmetyi TaxID=408139 RepID=UPI003EBE0C97